MLKLLLGHWHIHKKKPLLLPPEAELFAEGHNDQNPVNRINPLYEATDSDEINSIISIKNDVQISNPKKTENTAGDDSAVVQDGEPSKVQHSTSGNISNKAEQKEESLEIIDPRPTSNGLSAADLSEKNDDNEKEQSDDRTKDVKESQHPSDETSIVKESFEKSIKENTKKQEKSDNVKDLAESEVHRPHSIETINTENTKGGNVKPYDISKETCNINEIIEKEFSFDDVQVTEESTGASDDPQSSGQEDGDARASKLASSKSHEDTLAKAGPSGTNLRAAFSKDCSGTVVAQEESDDAKSLDEKVKYSANWVSIESNVEKEEPPNETMGVTREMETIPEAKTEASPPSGILKSSLKVRAKAIDDLIKKFQPTSPEDGIGRTVKVNAPSRKQRVFPPNRTKSDEVNGSAEIGSKEALEIEKKSEASVPPPPPPPPPEPKIASVSALPKLEKIRRNKETVAGEAGIVKAAISSAKPTPSSSKSTHAPIRPTSSFLFNGDNSGETKTSSSRIEDVKTSSKKTEETKTTSSSAHVNHGRFKKNERSASAKKSIEIEESSHPSSSSKSVSSQNDEIHEKKSGLISKEPEKLKLSKQSALKQTSGMDKTNKAHALKKVPKNDEVVKDESVPSKRDVKTSKTVNAALEKMSKLGETTASGAKDIQTSNRNSEWPSVKEKVDRVNKIKILSDGNGDVSPKSDSLIGKSQSEDSGITRGDQISSDSQISDKLQGHSEVPKSKDSNSEPALNGNTSNKLNANVPSPKAKPRHPKERKRLQKHGHHGKTCKHCKRVKHDLAKSPGLVKGNCDDYYDKVITEGLPGHRRIRRPDSWASDMSWEEFAERDFLARLVREERMFDKHKHLNSSFKRRLAKQRHLHGDPFHHKIHHPDEVFSNPDPYRNGGGRHHRGHRRQSSLSDDNSSLHFDPYYSRTPSVCSCEDCWSIPHFPQVNFGRSSVRSRYSDWNYNDLCTCHVIPDLLEHRRKVKFAENHSTHGPHYSNKEDRERANSEEDEEANSGSFGSGEHASSVSDANARSHSSSEGANDDTRSSSGSIRKEKTIGNGTGPKGDPKTGEQYQPHPWELEEWDRLMRHRLLKKRRRRAMCMGVMALAMVVFVGLVVAIVMVYLRRKML